jgi:two-component system, OmpR family, sensor histidine kinase ChvG
VSLRLQLLAFGLLTLVLPWNGFRYVQEMEAALRGGLEQSLLASASAVATALEEQSVPLCPSPQCVEPQAGSGTTIYAQPLREEPLLDGVHDDWYVANDAPLLLRGGHRLWAGVYGRYVYLFVAVEDRHLVYPPGPGRSPYGDRLVLALTPEAGRTRWVLLNTAAPGAFRGQETHPSRFEPTEVYDARVLAAWQETATGYAVEIRLPLNIVGSALGVGIINSDGADSAADLSATWDPQSLQPGRFVYQRPQLRELLTQFGSMGGRFRVLDSDGWVLSDTGSVRPRTGSSQSPNGWINDFFRFALSRNDPPYPDEQPPGRIADPKLREALDAERITEWFAGNAEQDSIVAAAVPIARPDGRRGAVLVEQASDPILTLTNQALVRLMTVTFLTSVVAAVTLLGYATWLSLRVRRLAQAAETALGPHGEIRIGIPDAAAKDELGDLARSFTHLLERLRQHTDYLRTLASKLSHELRTPLAVVSTSLDNLEHEVSAPSAEAYLRRLRQGTARLDAILGAMSEAAQLEQAINETAVEPVELATVVDSCCQAYRDVYPERDFRWRITPEPTRMLGSGELVAQLLDKLVDNAVGFSAPGSRIDVEVATAGRKLELSVTNQGPKLPARMREQLFDSLVSIRSHSDGRPHLGLGLHIVALVAKFHGGHASAEDLPDGSGVVFKVRFPRAES